MLQACQPVHSNQFDRSGMDWHQPFPGDESDGAEKITTEELEKWKETLEEEEKREEMDPWPPWPP